ncbi:hypothetical protein Zmor_027055 [Zophobas morio]|uniref:Uncharacterized protein n=1 Tax=Zophobas morio TaxID=2755281 RepID=A0AA38M0L4_9CUCU|nr:hypothetical protein Zmor_027055 [Zophobas morio]
MLAILTTNYPACLKMWKGWNMSETVSKSKTYPHIRLLFWEAKGLQSKKHELKKLFLRERNAVCTINEKHLLPNVVLNLCNFVTYRQDITDPAARALLS